MRLVAFLMILFTALPAAAQSQLGQAPAAPTRPSITTPTPAAPPAARPVPPPVRRPEAARPPATARPAATPVRPRPSAARPPASRPARRPATPPAAPPPAAAPATPTPEPAVVEPTRGSATGLPLPRFVPLRSDRVNLRVGPDTRFPVEWRYERRDLPVQIIREHEQWRRIRDVDGTEGWVHQSNLTPNRRTFLIRGNAAGEVPLRRQATAEAPVVARLRPGVIGRLRACEAASDWCEIQAGDSRGFVLRSEIFGALPGEKVE